MHKRTSKPTKQTLAALNVNINKQSSIANSKNKFKQKNHITMKIIFSKIELTKNSTLHNEEFISIKQLHLQLPRLIVH